MNYFWAFCVGGAICAAGQLLIDLTGLTPARILTGYVAAGVVLVRRLIPARRTAENAIREEADHEPQEESA